MANGTVRDIDVDDRTTRHIWDFGGTSAPTQFVTVTNST
jgi:hypothetical protein